MTVTSSENAESNPSGSQLYGLYVLAITACLVGNLLTRMGAKAGWLPYWGQVTLATLAVVPLFVAVGLFWRLLRRELDEMLQRIVLEGMAIALIVYIPLAALYVNLRTAGVYLPRLDPPDIILAPALLTAIGIAISRRRYQ